ncbi:hypothetical protein Acr_04g0002190 [Actinidia rufa]|uniref:Uncharacterized protein n=1 Tax=Actinidia rufa TaxID=165716 RepID=A0A7J0EG94_9ERIC|nr:hypothetical protein Acr_04g0002190 [Actinidia rufa]
MDNLLCGESSVLTGAREALSQLKTFIRRARSWEKLGELSPNGQPSWGESLVLTGARESLSQWKSFIRRARSWESSESSLQMDNLRGGELSTHWSSGSSLLMENLRRGELGAGGSWESSLQMDNLRGGESSELREAGKALSNWTTFVGESLVLTGARKLSPNGKPSSGRTRSCGSLEFSPNGQPFVGGELGTHGSSGSSLPKENLRQESSELGEIEDLSPIGQPLWGSAWYSQ